MSLANLIVQPTRAVLQADAAGCLPDGRVSAIRSKIIPFHTARLACSLRGSVDMDLWLSALNDQGLGQSASLHQLMVGLPEALHAATAATLERFECDGAACLYAVGWDHDRCRPFGILLTNSDLWFDGRLAAYHWQSVLQSYGSIEATEALLGPDVALYDPDKFDIEGQSVALAEAQRATPWGAWPIPDARVAVAHRIGGWLDQAEATSEGLTIRRLVTWPDRIGEIIQPSNIINFSKRASPNELVASRASPID